MRIAIDALAANFGGTAYAGVQVARALAEHPQVSRVAVVAQAGSIVAGGLVDHGAIELVEVGVPARGQLLHRSAWEAFQLPRLLRSIGAEGLFVLSGMLPRRPGVPVVGLQANPTVYGATTAGARLRRRSVAATSRWAVATYVPSEHIRRLAYDVERIAVVPLGVDRERFVPPAAAGSELLCVADFYPHKRHELLLDAYAALDRPRPTLRLIGNPAVAPSQFQRIAERARQIEGVAVDGRVSFAALLAAYRCARAFVIASEQESFCMPVAEALACGVPVIANDLPSLRETAGPGGTFIAGSDSAPWTVAMRAIIDDHAAWAAQRAAGVQHAERFSWHDYADRLVADLRAGIVA